MIGSTARSREKTPNLVCPSELANLWSTQGKEAKGALVLGTERTGLSNQELSLCTHLVTIPTPGPAASLNLAQAALLLLWELAQETETPLRPDAEPAESETVEDVRTWHPWEDYKTSYAVCRALGGGVIATQSHEVDLWYWLFGKPNMLTTRISVNKEFAPDVEVQARTKLLYPSFHIDHFVSYFGESKRTMRVEGSCGTLVWDLKAGVLEYKGDYQAPSQKHTASSEGTRSTSFVAELKHFLACIQGAAKPQNALPEAAEVFGILKSMYLSGQRSGVPIHIW